ncbi:AbrB/MazE/SpoVT family DNA-binding domain-containing protein [Haloechinothrix sp. LS1_15]|uniref:AbrB/MazE/SpoVT family DNA-binding domain-containing protein n=1 Tax=Haloechinothrix sp. LS1_15 TaxID=2652248 RepID=UPI002947AED7|nr:AbrB/MazE/SpoVT family DNA-binding domain-containing protein [Haloechinothrix sp. LS1_15]MDV6011238.1 AbrB/MazE/SpoVT family DNA-binding domain-containing protein [Haloechinothrix sp. LS1_15]
MSTHPQRRRATVRKKGQITLPPEVRAALYVDEGDEVEFTMSESGEVLLRGLTTIPADQRWFWTEEWQAGEREASAEIAAGSMEVHEDIETMLDDLAR